MHNPDRCPKPPARQPAAAAGQGRSRARRPRPGPPGFTYEVQLLGGEAGRRLAQEQAEAVAVVLAWLAGHPPTPPAATGPAATAATGKPVGQSTATPTGTRPAPPSPAGAADASTQPRMGVSGGAPTPKPSGSGPSGGPGILEGGGSWSSPPAAVRVQAVGLVGGAGRLGRSHGRWACTRRRCPLGLAGLAPVGDRHGPDAARQP